MKESLLILFNYLKSESEIPDFMKFAIVTTIPKKGSKLELKNERGIFRVSVIRSILMRSAIPTNFLAEINLGNRVYDVI